MDVTKEKNTDQSTPLHRLTSDDDIELFCIPCNSDGSLVSAHGYCQACRVHLCEACFHHHRRTAATMDHFLLDKDAMPKGHKSVHPSPTDKTEFCNYHPESRIDYCCIQHCFLGCKACIASEHKHCKVEFIPDVAKNVHHSEELRTIFSEIRALESKCQLNIITAKENIKRAKKDQHDVIQEIKSFRHELNTYLDQLEEKTLSKAHRITQTYIGNLESSKDACFHIASEMADLEGALKRLCQTDHLNALFVEMKKTEKKVEELKEEAEKAFEKSWKVDYKFERFDSVTEALRSVKKLGKIVESAEHFSVDKVSSLEHTDHAEDEHKHTVRRDVKEDHHTKPVLKYTGEVKVKSDKDEQEAHITGLTVMSQDRLAVVDNRNEKVKVVDLHENAVVSEVKLESPPFDVTTLPNHELAVTIPEEMAVQILHGNKLSPVRRLKFDKQCRGICFARDQLFVTFVAFPGEIKILTLQGEELKTLNDSFFGKRIFDLPLYVAVDEKLKHIYVSDYSRGQIIQLGSDGKLRKIFKCKKRGYPDGLAAINDKYVCFCCSSLHFIEIFTMDGHAYKAVDALKRDLQYPAALTTDSKKHMFGSFVPKGKKWLEKVCVFDIELPEE